MKKLSMLFMLFMAMAIPSGFAQEVTIYLMPGWTWISCPNTETTDIVTSLGDFVPAEGDIISSQYGYTTYVNGQWRGSLSYFMPGWGYMYKSNRTEPVALTFGASVSQLIVITTAPTEITATSAICGGTVTSNDVSIVLMKGICWATHENPTLDDDYMEDESGPGSFSVSMTGLNPNTQYYVQAYAISEIDTIYGNEVSFSTLEDVPLSPEEPQGIINGLFTINEDGAQVYFSQGNLQYQASTEIWQFAENQWGYIGTDNQYISSNYDGWIDLFGWGTSGYHNIYDNFNVNYQPYSTSSATVNTECNTYGYGPSTNMYDPNLTGLNAGYDWGVYNAISNGGNQAGLWRTLSKDEWVYVFDTRSASTVGNVSNARFAKATVNGVKGFILFPDVFSLPIYLPTPLQINNAYATFNVNSYSVEGWAVMENLGCVFLPAAGYRSLNYVYETGNYGYYWSTSNSSSSGAYSVFFNNSNMNLQNIIGRCNGLSVRLVRDAE